MNNSELNNNQNTQPNTTMQPVEPTMVNTGVVLNTENIQQVNNQPTVTPTPVQQPQQVAQPVVTNTEPSVAQPVDDNAMVNENLKKVEVNYTPPSKGKTILLILFFIALIAFVIFLPEITEMIDKMKSEKNAPADVKITQGTMKCTYKTNTTNLDKDYRIVFGFTDNKLETLDYRITTKGDATLDEKTLDSLADTCKKLKEEVKKIDGVSVSCDYSEGKLTEKQVFTYSDIEEKKLDAAYAESGGTMPQYSYRQDMDSIEKSMNAAGYTCFREKK